MKKDKELKGFDLLHYKTYMKYHVSQLRHLPSLEADWWKKGQKIFMEKKVNRNE